MPQVIDKVGRASKRPENFNLELNDEGDVVVTVTTILPRGESFTMKTTVDQLSFMREVKPITAQYSAGHRDGITDLLPPADEKESVK